MRYGAPFLGVSLAERERTFFNFKRRGITAISDHSRELGDKNRLGPL